MKKLNYFLLGLAGLTLASCSQDDLLNSTPNGEGNYQITVNLPSNLTTRATTNDGLQANNLVYYVYDLNDGNPTMLYTNTASFNGGISTTVNLNLIPGQEYKITFFAYADGAFGTGNVYDIDEATGVMTVNYDKMNSAGYSADTYDCFANVLATGEIGKDVVSSSVTLYRPMAQINWGTNDFSGNLVTKYFGTPKPANVYPYLESQLTADVYTQFSLLDNDVVTESKQSGVELGFFTQPLNIAGNALLGFPVNGSVNKYVAMQYVLAPQSEELLDLNLSIDNGNNAPAEVLAVDYDVEVPNAPIQANYQTNIYGSLLSENVTIEVTKNKYWSGINNFPLGDKGTEISPDLWVNNDLNTIVITGVEGMKTYANLLINNASPAGLNGFPANAAWSNYSTYLDEDINLQGENWTPFPNRSVNFDGQGHVISNMNVSVTGEGNYAGFMSSTQGYVSNIVFEGATVNAEEFAGVLGGYGISSRISNITVKDSKVTSVPFEKGSSYDGANKVGAIVGYLTGQGSGNLSDCYVSGCTLTGYREVGGLTGYAANNVFVSNSTVENTTIYCNLTKNYKNFADATAASVNQLIGYQASTCSTSNLTADNVTVLTITDTGYAAGSYEALQAIASLGSSPLYNKTITLTQDIDLGGQTIDPIDFGAMSSDFNNSVIDGQGHTISNFTVDGSVAPSSHSGLFANFHGKIKDLTIKNMNITGNTTGSVGVVGYFVGTMENVKVYNSQFPTAAKNSGALVGICTGGTFTNCLAQGCEMTGQQRIGGLVGQCNEGSSNSFNQCSVIDCTMTSTASSNAGTIVGELVGGATASYNNCTVTNSKVNGVVISTPGVN